MFPSQLRRGAFVDGRRVVAMSPARRSHVTGVSVRLDGETTPRFYPHGQRVPGTRPRTDMPAGPVGSGKQPMLTSNVGRRGGESPTDRLARLIDSIVYA